MHNYSSNSTVELQVRNFGEGMAVDEAVQAEAESLAAAVAAGADSGSDLEQLVPHRYSSLSVPTPVTH